MNTENVVKHLRVLWRTDRMIADLRMRHLLIGLGLMAFAALIAAVGLLNTSADRCSKTLRLQWLPAKLLAL